jgi:signal transduction histidine kinase
MESGAINPLVAHAVALLERDLKRAGVDVSLELDTGLPPVYMDRIGIEQVISNLLRNAGDAMAGGTGKKHIHVRTCLSLVPPLGEPPGWVTVRVTDMGAGLGGRNIETLTEPFFSTKREGTGLGLAICRSILEAHGGRLHAQDAPNAGAQFSFSLPPEALSVEAHPP